MGKYLFKRTLQLLPILLVIIIVNFVLVRLAPGDPTYYLIGDTTASEEFINQLRRDLGLDQPLHIQLGLYVWQILQGDLGYSFASRQPVVDIILSRLPATLLLMGTQFVLSVAIGIWLGVIAARRRGSALDHGVTFLSLIGFSVPVFWLAQMMIFFFSLQLNLFPSQGMMSLRYEMTSFERFFDVAHHLALPALSLTIFNLALVARLTRANMVNMLRMEFITFARSKGLKESAVVWTHALRNALLPVVTVVGLNVRTLIAGAVLTETVFAWPGLGRLTFDAIFARDYPLLMGILVVVGITVIVANLLTDLAYAYLDPRVRYQ